MEIEWINHAGFVLRDKELTMAVDPWIEGLAFNHGWHLLSKTMFKYDDFKNINYIWFSHEHPDHFMPPNLKKINKSILKEISVIFQKTNDNIVSDFCKHIGFGNIIETKNEFIKLNKTIDCYIEDAGRGDSWIAIKNNELTILNINDCIFMEKEPLYKIMNTVGKIDVLMTQFSYASWWGNKEDREAWKNAAKEQLIKVQREIVVFKPKYTILFASFVYFCHEENFYMNENSNSPRTAVDFVNSLGLTNPIVLYPGDKWTIGDFWDNEVVLKKYENDILYAKEQSVIKSKKVEIDNLKKSCLVFINKLKKFNFFYLWFKLPKAKIYLIDHNIYVTLSISGLKVIKKCDTNYDVALSSDSLANCFDTNWGGETLMINGRFQEGKLGNKANFFRWFSIAQTNSRKTYYDLKYYIKKLLHI